MYNVWKLILDTQPRQDRKRAKNRLQEKCGEHSRLFKGSISIIKDFIISFIVLCESLWNTSSGLKTAQSTSLEYSTDDPSTQQLFGQHWHILW